MDKTDMVLSLLLLANSRLTYSELAVSLGLSVNAVHKRIQALVESGVIRAFTAKVSLSALKVTTVLIYGKSEASPVGMNEKLRRHESTYWLAVAGGGYLYIGAYLRGIEDLEAYVEFVKREAGIPYPNVCIVSPEGDRPGRLEELLDELDYRIIYVLRKDSRKAVSEIADELGVSAKTVRRRLDRMVREKLIDLSLEWYPDVSDDIISIFHLTLKPQVDRSDASSSLGKKYFPNLLFFWSFSNLPNELVGIAWTNTMKGLREITESLAQEGAFESVTPNILYTGYIFDTWRDKLVEEKDRARNRVDVSPDD